MPSDRQPFVPQHKHCNIFRIVFFFLLLLRFIHFQLQSKQCFVFHFSSDCCFHVFCSALSVSLLPIPFDTISLGTGFQAKAKINIIIYVGFVYRVFVVVVLSLCDCLSVFFVGGNGDGGGGFANKHLSTALASQFVGFYLFYHFSRARYEQQHAGKVIAIYSWVAMWICK